MSDKEALTSSDGRSRLTASNGWASLADGKHRSPPGDQRRCLTWDQGYAARRIASPTSREKRNPELGVLSQHPMGDFETQDIERVSLARRGGGGRFEDSRDSWMVFGGQTRTAATARPRCPSDGKLGRWLRLTLYGRPILTESNGSVSSTKGEAVSRLAVRLSPTPNGGTIPACVGRVSVASMVLEKARLSGRECSHRRPTGDQNSLCRTGEDGKVKFGRMLSRHSTGGHAHMFDGLASLT